MEKNREQDDLHDLCRALTGLASPEICAEFLRDLCTPAELHSMTGRWKVAVMLRQKIPYRRINELTGVSTATITRVARFMDTGHGGYQKALALLDAHSETTSEKNRD